MAIRNIRTNEDEILRKKCKHVDKIDARIQGILNDMADTMYQASGAGLAGNQIGVLRRLVVMDVGEGLLKLVNPEIVSEEGIQDVVEGCLSFPDVWGKLTRPARVVVKALNEKCEPVTIEGEGLKAKCLCHEIDHLNGIVFTDKVTEYVDMDGE